MVKKIDEKEFKEACRTSISMAAAAVKLKLHFGTFRKYSKLLGVYKPNMGLKGGTRVKPSYVDFQEVLEGKHPFYSKRRVKERLFQEGIKEKVCECCGLGEWNSKPIPLEIHHKDGDRSNHRLENLEIICPNCHAQTDTYRGKSK